MGKKRKAAESTSFADHPKRPKGKAGFKEKHVLTFEARPDWHAAELPALPDSGSPASVPKKLLDDLYTHAVALLDEESERFSARSSATHDPSRKFMSTVMSNGTQEDRISALTLAVQESPLHNRKPLDSLIALAKKRSRNQALPALSAIVDLMAQGLVLPENRRLSHFANNSGLLEVVGGHIAEGSQIKAPFRDLPRPLEPIHLLYWAYEDYLKRTYFDLVQALEMWCNDEVEYSRSRALGFIYNLLTERPEQEENLLLLLVNKLGDRSRKVASRASYFLLQLQIKHPMMKPIIIKAIESEILFRPGQQAGAKYYAVITLNQTVLSRAESGTADKLLQIYIGLFLALLKQSDGDAPSAEPAGNKKNKKFGGKKTKAGQKARKRLAEEQVAREVNDRMIAQILSGINRAFPFADTDGAQFELHLNTIYRITHSANFNTSVQALMLLHQITTAKQCSIDRYYRVLYESLLDYRLHRSSKQVMYLNLLYKAIKADLSIKRVKAFVKRLLQVASIHEPSFACAVLYLISELMKVFPALKNMLSEPEEKADDEEERFVDVPEDGEGVIRDEEKTDEQVEAELAKFRYDGRKRDPELSNADRSCIWELIPSQVHFHPSVSLFASSILNGGKIPPKPDPTLHTLIHFLDRFVYRGARKSKGSTARGASIMQPLVGSDQTDVLVRNRTESRLRAPINDQAFWQKKVDEVAADEVFFHQYFHSAGKAKASNESKAKRGRGGDESDAGDAGDEEEIWKALVQSRPEIEGDDDDEFLSDDDVDMEGVDFDDDDLDAAEGDVFADDDGDDNDDGDDLDGLDLGLESDAGSDDDDVSLPSDVEAVLDEIESKTGTTKSKSKSAGKKVKFGGIDEEEEEEEEEEEPKTKSKSQQDRERRKKLKSLPTFASAEDYAALIDG